MQGIEVWPNTEAAGNYNGEVGYLTTWLGLRIGYLDSVFNAKTQSFTTLMVPSGAPRQGSRPRYRRRWRARRRLRATSHSFPAVSFWVWALSMQTATRV